MRPPSSPRQPRRLRAFAAAALLLGGCATVPVPPSDQQAFEPVERVQARRAGDVAVEATILDDEQARRHFGVDLGVHGVQAAWFSVANGSRNTLSFVHNLLDPDFFSADEVARMVAGGMRARDFDRVRQFLRDESMRVRLEPATASRGFVFLPRTEGGRFLDVTLLVDSTADGEPDAPEPIRFGFAIPLPDGDFDYERLDPARLYDGQPRPDLDLRALRAAIESLPCCTTDADGEREGDPLNLVLLGSADEVLNALERGGWSFTHRITFASVRREVAAAIAGDAYPVAPVSALYALGRRHDIALQRARQSLAQRNHLRLWLAPFRADGRDVWIGQVSRDIGVKVTPRSPTLTTHVIDPEIDAAREYLLHSLLAQGLVERFGFARGGRQAGAESPARNLTGDPYFSDGVRLVAVVARDPLPVQQARNLGWERSAAPIASGQGPGAARNVRQLDDTIPREGE